MTAPNSLQAALSTTDEVALGAGATTFTPAIVEVYGDVGLDFVWVDLEHSGLAPYDSTRLDNLTRAADVAGTHLVVRIPEGEPAMIRKVLDAGVDTVVIPRVETAEEVRRAVEAARFTYDGAPGERGVGYGRGNRWGGDVDADYTAREDASVTVGAMIEQAAAIDNLDEILAVPDLGFVFLGHYDLGVSMGYPTPDAEPVREAIRTVREASRAAGVPFGRNVEGDPDEIDAAADAGYRLLLLGNDLGAARRVYGGAVDRFRGDAA